MYHHFNPYVSSRGYLEQLAIILVPMLIIGIPALINTIIEMRKPLTEEQYQEWCKEDYIYISFVSSMPYSLENYVQPDRNSFLLVRNEQKTWRLFRLNSRDQKDWNASQWKAEENEIKISDVEGLEKIIKELPDVLPENLPPKEKNYVKARILTLFGCDLFLMFKDDGVLPTPEELSKLGKLPILIKLAGENEQTNQFYIYGRSENGEEQIVKLDSTEELNKLVFSNNEKIHISPIKNSEIYEEITSKKGHTFLLETKAES